MDVRKYIMKWTEYIVGEIEKRTPMAGENIRIDKYADCSVISVGANFYSSALPEEYKGPFQCSQRIYNNQPTLSVDIKSGFTTTKEKTSSVSDTTLDLSSYFISTSVIVFIYLDLIDGNFYTTDTAEKPEINYTKTSVLIAIVYGKVDSESTPQEQITEIIQCQYGNIRKDSIGNCPRS